MGGGDLNTKKSWHPTNRSNQERVWKAEQKEAAEKKRLAELQREIQDERDREDLKNVARSSGFLDDGDSANKKLEWMYRGQQLNRDEYLMGRAIDKNFEQLDAEEKVKADPIHNPAISVPINHVEHEVIPFSIRQYKGLPGTEQVDMARKMLEDPLMLIKQKEMENRREILQNPVKLKELHKMLKEERSKKKSKKEKKSKKKHKKSRSDSDNEDVDLDRALAEKYKRLQGALAKDLDSDDDVNADVNVDKLLTLKFEALSKELDKMTGTKKKKKKKRESDSSSEDFPVTQKSREAPKRNRSRSPQRRDDRERYTDQRRRTPEHVRRRSRSPQKRNFPRNDNRRYRGPDRFRDDRRDRNQSPRRRSRSPDDRHSSNWNQQRRKRSRSIDRRQRNRSPERRERRSRTPEKRQKSPPEPQSNRNRSPPSSSSSSSDSSPDRQNDDSDDDRPAKKTFGLVTSDGKGISIKKSLPKRRSLSPKSRDKPSKSVVATKQEPKARPARMTQEEIDARLKEMMSNASWREKERSEKVQKYRENEKREQEESKKEFDKDFLTRQLKKTANSTTSVESRIKSNLNNIQRSSRTMESHFARR